MNYKSNYICTYNVQHIHSMNKYAIYDMFNIQNLYKIELNICTVQYLSIINNVYCTQFIYRQAGLASERAEFWLL